MVLLVTACEGVAGCEADGVRLCVSEGDSVEVEVALRDGVITLLPLVDGDGEAAAEVVPLTDAVWVAVNVATWLPVGVSVGEAAPLWVTLGVTVDVGETERTVDAVADGVEMSVPLCDWERLGVAVSVAVSVEDIEGVALDA